MSVRSKAVNAGRADYVPIFLSDIPPLFRNGAMPVDVALINVAPPDQHGYCSLGTSVDVAKAAAEHARHDPLFQFFYLEQDLFFHHVSDPFLSII